MYNATIVKRIDLTSQLVLFHVRPDAEVPSFEPGQYVALGLLGSAARGEGFKPDVEGLKPDKLIKRAYSIGSAPGQNYLELYIALVDDGALTPRLAMLQEGDRLHMAGKIVGTFTLKDIPTDHNAVLVSTGTGIAPFVSMIRTPACWTAGRRFTVVHGVRYVPDLAYREELEAFAAQSPNLRYTAIVSRADESWTGPRGHVQKLFEDGVILLEPERDHVFLCGNPAMIEGMQQLLEGRGYREHTKRQQGNLHLEKYW